MSGASSNPNIVAFVAFAKTAGLPIEGSRSRA